jgi:hypothetical protein
MFYRKPFVILLGFGRVGMWRGFADFRLSPGFIPDADSDLGSLHCVDVVSVASVSKAYADSVFEDKMSRVGECLCMHRFPSNRPTTRRVRAGARAWPVRIVDSRQGNVIENGPIKSHRELQRSMSNWSSQAVIHPSARQAQ